MKRIHLLASEIFSYSYANYDDHLSINDRFDKYMPDDAALLETAIKRKWPLKKVAKKLDVSPDIASQLLTATQQALAIVDAKTPAASFREGVKQSVLYALEQGIHNEKDVDNLVTQICYRAADFGFLLDTENQKLSYYSRYLRDISDMDFDED
ncbi:MAG TPA: hypothetical protein ENJ60_03065 [Aeromonadales bacterium]|nr:hypothetical protein [Aeromonadales bacterium]